jgi:hypothetical protein
MAVEFDMQYAGAEQSSVDVDLGFTLVISMRRDGHSHCGMPRWALYHVSCLSYHVELSV